MRSNIPVEIQQNWALYNSTEAFLVRLWETNQGDFMEYYFPEITGDPYKESPEPDFEGDDIPF